MISVEPRVRDPLDFETNSIGCATRASLRSQHESLTNDLGSGSLLTALRKSANATAHSLEGNLVTASASAPCVALRDLS